MKKLTKKANTLYPKVKVPSYEVIPFGTPILEPGEYLISPSELVWGHSYKTAISDGVVLNFELPRGIYTESSEYYPIPELPFVSSYTTMIERDGDLLYVGLGVSMTSGAAPYGEGNRRVGTYNLKTGEWTPDVLSYFPINCYNTTSTLIDGKFVAIPGYDFASSAQSTRTYVCDLNESNLWKRAADISANNVGTGQRSAVLTHPDGLKYFHIFGGYDSTISQEGNRHLMTHSYYDPRNDVWTELPDLPARIKFHYHFYTEESIYLFGGTVVALDTFNTDVYRYTVENGWEVVGQADLEAAGVWHNSNGQGKAAIVGNKAYFEAYSQGAEDYETYVSSIDINTFELEQNVFMFPSEEYSGTLIEVDDAIYYVGAYSAKNDYSEGLIFYYIKV